MAGDVGRAAEDPILKSTIKNSGASSGDDSEENLITAVSGMPREYASWSR
jgi:hypothetical protein